MNELEMHRRKLPHWTLSGSVYYLTFSLIDGALSDREVEIVLSHIKVGHRRYYNLYAVQVMPNHVHCILKPLQGIALPRILKGIKGVTARLINKLRGSSGSIWLDESFDRIIRDEEEFRQKLKYMYENPIRAGLVENPEEYGGWYAPEWE